MIVFMLYGNGRVGITVENMIFMRAIEGLRGSSGS